MTHPGAQEMKLMIVGRRRPGTTLAELHHHMRHVHGELVLRYIADDPANAPIRYVQHQVFEGQFRAAPPGTDPFALQQDFVTQIWTRDLAALARSRETAFYRDQLSPDEARFVDQASVVFMPVKARAVKPRSAPDDTAIKLFGFVQKAPGADDVQFLRAWTDATVELDGAAAGAILGHVKNDVLTPPGTPAGVHGVDEFWLPDEAAARALLPLWRSAVHQHLVAPGLALDSGSFALLACEAVLHAGSH